jgi:hypothetical protein
MKTNIYVTSIKSSDYSNFRINNFLDFPRHLYLEFYSLFKTAGSYKSCSKAAWELQVMSNPYSCYKWLF